MGKQPNRRQGILTKRQLVFAAAHLGNDTEAARAAGYKNSENAAPKLMGNPSIRKAIGAKQQAVIQASGAGIGRRLTRLDIVNRLLELANLPPVIETKLTLQAQVAALRVS
jgi:phage terminase small subunit